MLAVDTPDIRKGDLIRVEMNDGTPARSYIVEDVGTAAAGGIRLTVIPDPTDEPISDSPGSAAG